MKRFRVNAQVAHRPPARKRRIAPVIPHKADERDKPAFFAHTLYKVRARIEQGVGRLKLQAHRVTLRKDGSKTSDQSSPSPQAHT
jgi:hypothetical protein